MLRNKINSFQILKVEVGKVRKEEILLKCRKSDFKKTLLMKSKDDRNKMHELVKKERNKMQDFVNCLAMPTEKPRRFSLTKKNSRKSMFDASLKHP